MFIMLADPEESSNNRPCDASPLTSADLDDCRFAGGVRRKLAALLIGSQLLTFGCSKDPKSVHPQKFTRSQAGQLVVPSVWEADELVHRFLEDSVTQRLLSAKALKLSPEVAVPALAKTVAEHNPYDLVPIVSLLGELGPKAAPAVLVLIAKFKDSNVRGSADHPIINSG